MNSHGKRFSCNPLKYLLPLAIVSGTRTIEPGRALSKAPAANAIGATEAAGADTSWLFEYDADDATDDPCDAFESVLTVLTCVVVAAAVLTLCCGIEAPAAAGASFSSWPGTTKHAIEFVQSGIEKTEPTFKSTILTRWSEVCIKPNVTTRWMVQILAQYQSPYQWWYVIIFGLMAQNP